MCNHSIGVSSPNEESTKLFCFESMPNKSFGADSCDYGEE
jgi:hypothetical protein